MTSESNLSRRSLLSAMFLLPGARLLRGRQENPQQPPATFSADVKVVNLFAIVRDKKGKIVNNLAKDDFLLDEDGRPQTIKFFNKESNLPLTLGLLVDTSGSQRNALNSEREASQRFFAQILREDRDLAFLIHFDFEVELLQDLTPSREKLEKALDLLQIGQRDPNQQQGGNGNPGGNQGGGYPPGGGYPGGGYPGGGYPRRRYPGGGYPGGGGGMRGGGTKLYDSIMLACDELMKKQKGRKALVLLTNGVDHGSKTTLFEAIASAQRTDTLVYSVLFGDSESAGPVSFGGMGRRPMGGPGYGGENGKKVLEQIARETGGGFFQISRSHTIDQAYATIEEELRNQYNLGYTSDQPGESGVYRHIHLTVKTKSMVVQTRE
ncbi:MAG TPA: VWA domain-containing protein, partial [Candidatus Sulfopaludibacter sp.]|nr:VWA domain-containing protein [Candidatus Sulfopaludibacter sp.]